MTRAESGDDTSRVTGVRDRDLHWELRVHQQQRDSAENPMDKMHGSWRPGSYRVLRVLEEEEMKLVVFFFACILKFNLFLN